MINNTRGLNTKHIFISAILYLIGLVLNYMSYSFLSKENILVISCSVACSIIFFKGIKGLVGILSAGLIWLLVALINPNFLFGLKIFEFFAFVIIESLAAILFVKLIGKYYEPKVINDQLGGAAKAIAGSLIATIPVSTFLSLVLYNDTFFNTTEFWFKYQQITLGVLIPLLLLPSTLNLFDTSRSNFKPLKLLNYFNIFTLLIIICVILYGSTLPEPLYFIALQLIVLMTVLVIGVVFYSNSFLINLALVLFSFFLSASAFGFDDNHILVLKYLYVVIIILSLLTNSLVRSKIVTIESFKKNFLEIQNDIEQQTQYYRSLNHKLLEEIDLRATTQRELNLSRKLLEDSQEIAGIASWELVLPTKQIRWSDNAYQIIGVDSNEEISTFDEYIKTVHPDDVSKFISIYKRAKEATTYFEAELRHLRKDGSTNYVLIRGRSFDSDGAVNRIVGLSFDITERKKFENELTEKELKYRTLFESNIESVCLIDAESLKIVDINNAFEHLYGYSRDEIIGKEYSFITPNKSEASIDFITAIKKGSHRTNLRVNTQKNSTEIFVESSIVKFTLGNKPMLFVLSHDITARKNAEKKLADRELQFRLFFESDLIGMAELNIQKQWINFNNKLCEILEYTPKELKELTWDRITHPQDLPDELKMFNDIITHRIENYTIDKRFIKSNGREVYCKTAVKSIKSSTGNISHLVVLVEDISLRKKAQEELVENQQKLIQAQRIANLGSLTLNPTTNSILPTDEAILILGLSKNMGTYHLNDLLNIIESKDRSLFTESLNKILSGNDKESGLDICIKTKEGSTKFLQLNIGSNSAENQQMLEIVITIVDITKIKQAELTLQEANMLKDQLFSILAHDLRNPIGSINQLLTFFHDSFNTFDRETQLDILNTLKSTSNQTYELLESLLEWAKIQRKKTFDKVKIDVNTAIVDSTTLLSGMSNSKGIIIEKNIESDMVVFADEQMFRTIIRNLLSNAIKFSPKNGRILIKGWTADENAIISIADNGKGIPEEHIDKIFDINSTYTTLGTDKEVGSGLGLKLVKSFIEKNNGEIEVESNPDQGTIFRIYFPKLKTNQNL